MTVETLRWSSDRLELIDQRVLPAQFRYLAYDSAQAVAQGIRDMVVRGAPAIGVAAAYGIALEAQRQHNQPIPVFKEALSSAFEVLAQSRPTAVNLFWALKTMRDTLNTALVEVLDIAENPKTVASTLLKKAHSIYLEDIAINRTMGSYGEKLLKDGARVLTHCNAGALATAGHGTALGVIRSAVEAGKNISVFADETRPFLQGARLTAWELVQEGISCTVITDSMAGHLMAREEIDAVIVGADRVAANGDVANKIGTYMVAVLAHRHNIPFYVACPLSTIDMEISSGIQIPIEERNADEVKGFRGLHWAAEGVSIRNPAFDVTPAELVTALITEKGVVMQPNREKLTALFYSDCQNPGR